MARLPQPGSDNGTWGDILNDYLSQVHKPDGSLKDDVVTADTIRNGTIGEAQLSGVVQAKLNAGSRTPDWDAISGKPAIIAAGSDQAAARAAIGAGTGTVLDTDVALNVVKEGGIAPDSTTNVRAAIQALVTANAGRRIIRFPKGTYRVGTTGATSGSNRITLPSGTHIVCDPGVVFEINQLDYASGTTVFYAAGTESAKRALQTDIAAGAQQITLPTGQGATFTRGNLVAVEANTAVTPDTSEDTGVGLAREIRMVTVVAGDTLTLDAPLEYSYAAGADAVFSKITPVTDVSIEGARFTSGPGVTPGNSTPSPQLTYPIKFKWAQRCRIDNVSLSYVTGGIHFFECYDSHINNCSGDMLMMQDVPATSAGYVTAFVGATTKCSINNLSAAECRHAFTTLADERAGGTFWGGPMHCQINDSIGYGGSNGGTAVWDTHEFGRHIEFNNCQAIGGLSPAAGFQIRSQDTTLTNCRAIRNARNGLRVYATAKRLRVIGGEFSYSDGAGISIDGADHRLSDVVVHHNGGAGIFCGFATCTNLAVDGGDIHGNTNYGVQATNSVSPSFIGLRIPYSAAQPTSYQSLPATAEVIGGSCRGYGTNSIGTPASTGAPATGAVISGVISDSGIVNNRPIFLGGSGGAPQYDVPIYRSAFNVARLDGIFRANDGEIQFGDVASSGGIQVLMSSSSPGGSPEGVVSANPGSLFIRRGGGAGQTLYVKESGTSNTGWVAK